VQGIILLKNIYRHKQKMIKKYSHKLKKAPPPPITFLMVRPLYYNEIEKSISISCICFSLDNTNNSSLCYFPFWTFFSFYFPCCCFFQNSVSRRENLVSKQRIVLNNQWWWLMINFLRKVLLAKRLLLLAKCIGPYFFFRYSVVVQGKNI
jgi:hypothetical protein